MNRTSWNIIAFIFVALLTSCQFENTEMKIDIQGHRGCRGILPENTIPAFERAIDIGVTTLEMDLAITKDSIVIVSHEPFFNYEISTHPEGIEITHENHMSFNIYRMTYDEVKRWDVGTKAHSRFPDQEKMKVSKPTLDEVFSFAEAYASSLDKDNMLYNIEIKSSPKSDNIFHPQVSEFADLVIDVVKNHNISDRVTIQSFDIRALQYVKNTYPEMETALLISNDLGIEENIKVLGFTPDIYSPDFQLVNTTVVKFCQENEIKLIPWTVNDIDDINKMLEAGVYGIISDFPDLVVAAVKGLKN